MNRPVFTNDHLESVCDRVRASRKQAELELENAALKEIIADLIEAGGSALHSMFVAGGEPKWRHDSERQALINLSDSLHLAFSKISGGAV